MDTIDPQGDDNRHELNTLLHQTLRSFSRRHYRIPAHFGGKQFLCNAENDFKVCLNKRNVEIVGFSHDGEKKRNLRVSEVHETVNNQARMEYVERLLELYKRTIDKDRSGIYYVLEHPYREGAIRNRLLSFASTVLNDKLHLGVEYSCASNLMLVTINSHKGDRRLMMMPITPVPRIL